MRYNSYRTPGLGSADALFERDLVLKPPDYAADDDLPPAEDDDEPALRLDRERPERPARRQWRGPPRGVLLMGGWAIVLGVALGGAYFVQAARLPTPADTEPPPAVAPQPEDLGEPVTAPSIASQPDRFAQATSAPEINPPEADAPAAATPGGLQIAEAAPPADAAPAPTAVADATAPAAASEPAVLKAAAEKPEKTKPVVRLEKASAASKADLVDEPAAKPVKAAKTEKTGDAEKAVKAEAAAKSEKVVADKAKGADAKSAEAKDLPQLKARINRAYAEAVKAGTPKSVLKARQAEWQTLRAKAEKKGPAAVAALYRTRAAQLEAIAKKSAVHGHGKV